VVCCGVYSAISMGLDLSFTMGKWPEPTVAVLRTTSVTVIQDYARALRLADYRKHSQNERPTVPKVSVS